ncbi:unnamed protein product [Polarella glacialis]|uniref:Ketosynthase family 3 (KS3) domain-containing protein n=1 Tax=Polarella glacialis TaxID=89957 RepID=A0A813FKR8_POLGL|nr:unnamed protein product [Polarella glacialis]
MTDLAVSSSSTLAQAEESRLVGRLVEISGTVDLHDQARGSGNGQVDADGERGRVEGWLAGPQRYLVRTFSGLHVTVPEANLTEFQPAEPEEFDGFDVAWPSAPAHQEAFSTTVAQKVNEKGYCVIQMFPRPRFAKEIEDEVRELHWGILQGDVEEDYLGTDLVDGKVSWLQYESPDEAGRHAGLRTYDLDDMDPDMRIDSMGSLEGADKALTNMAALLWPLTPEYEDDKSFIAWGRTSGLVRASMGPGDEGVRSRSLGRDDQEELDLHIGFVDQKKLCILYLIDNDGGELDFIPSPEGYDYNEATIPLSKNKIVVFRCDSMGMNYCYRPAGKNLALQAWVLDTPTAMKEKEEALRIIDGPEEPAGRRNNIMSVQTRYPGLGFCPQAYWNMLLSGADTQVQVPIQRWDIDIYYREEKTMGYSMTCHGATLQQSEIEQFDNKFFGINDVEASVMSPYMRVMLEVGYECLWNAGYQRSDLNGWHCGVFVGDSGSDWDSLVWVKKDMMPYYYAGRERSAACTRMSHIFGMVGPCSTAETACSSSLVACGIAQMHMRQKTEEQKTPNMTVDLKHALVIGTNTIIGPGSYISLSGPGMLTRGGRCFTFDTSADGFARGEGIGAINLKVCEDSWEAAGRVAMLIGCAINQDGRSASMTAPHGPSQQAVIRESMREAGVSPNLITIAECHGTGTALGDPIEVGALRGVMRADRKIPILKTSAKSNIGHLEAGAGIAGLIKCISMLNYSCGTANVHLLCLNPHLDVAGYPVYFETEPTDFGSNSGLTGVSSFGFGGTNARADVWGHATKGARYSITGPMQTNKSIAY